MRLIFIAVLALLVASCSASKLEESALTPQERSLVRGALQDVSRGDSSTLSKKVDPNLAPKIAPALGEMRAQLPPPPLEVSFANANWNLTGGTRTVNAIYQVEGRSAWALADVTLQTSSGRTTITGLYIQKVAGGPREANSFSLTKASAAGWAMLAAMLAAVGVTIAAIFRIWRSGQFSRRWLWTFGSLIGLTTLRMNWSSGEVSFQPISFQLLSVSAFKSPIYAPWILAVSVPIVALIALLRRRRETPVDINSVG